MPSYLQDASEEYHMVLQNDHIYVPWYLRVYVVTLVNFNEWNLSVQLVLGSVYMGLSVILLRFV